MTSHAQKRGALTAIDADLRCCTARSSRMIEKPARPTSVVAIDWSRLAAIGADFALLQSLAERDDGPDFLLHLLEEVETGLDKAATEPVDRRCEALLRLLPHVKAATGTELTVSFDTESREPATLRVKSLGSPQAWESWPFATGAVDGLSFSADAQGFAEFVLLLVGFPHTVPTLRPSREQLRVIWSTAELDAAVADLARFSPSPPFDRGPGIVVEQGDEGTAKVRFFACNWHLGGVLEVTVSVAAPNRIVGWETRVVAAVQPGLIVD